MRGFFLPFRFLSVSDRPNTEFWFTQCMILASTVLGVYLASFAGFQIAVDFDRYQSMSDVNNLERSLEAEFSDNLDKVDAWIAAYPEAPMTWHANVLAPREAHKLDDMVWETMRYSQRTFEVNPKIITGVRRFYGDIQSQMTILFMQQNANGYARNAMKKMQEIVSTARADVLPLIQSEINRLDEELADLTH
ncbi:hypothetical protein ACQ0MK_12905 [Thalassospira lucentensis]|uniref:hypothetical protein n=1 Tax=Thalassospira lucentensis TaxID=168935 RepID=UPI003D2EDE2A